MFDLYDININFKTQGEVISKKDLVFDLFFYQHQYSQGGWAV